jgi:hypothetical protein
VTFALPALALTACALAASVCLPAIAWQGQQDAATARVIRVGPGGDVASVGAAARLARSGDVVEIAAGEYVDDVAVWPQDHLVVRAVGGRARLASHGMTAQDKAIFVVQGDDVTIEGLDFAGAHVQDRNGAGIRHEGGRLTVIDCLFEDNEMGLLAGNDPRAEVTIERSEFRHNRVAGEYRAGDRIGHQIYIGMVGRFTLEGSYVHGGAFGHLVKSRARESHIVANRLTDEAGGRASYELEFPNGGRAYVLGNLIGQSATTENGDIVSFGAEGYRWDSNELYLVNNTLVDDLASGGRVLHVHPGAGRVDVLDNVVFGNRLEHPGAPGRFAANYAALWRDAAAPGRYDYRLRRGSHLVGRAQAPGSAHEVPLHPQREYVHPRASRMVTARTYSPGAFQGLAP